MYPARSWASLRAAAVFIKAKANAAGIFGKDFPGKSQDGKNGRLNRCRNGQKGALRRQIHQKPFPFSPVFSTLFPEGFA